jgi:hypothetical protein
MQADWRVHLVQVMTAFAAFGFNQSRPLRGDRFTPFAGCDFQIWGDVI